MQNNILVMIYHETLCSTFILKFNIANCTATVYSIDLFHEVLLLLHAFSYM